VLKLPSLRSLLVEINKASPADVGIIDILGATGSGYLGQVGGSNRRVAEDIMPAANMIFAR